MNDANDTKYFTPIHPTAHLATNSCQSSMKRWRNEGFGRKTVHWQRLKERPDTPGYPKILEEESDASDISLSANGPASRELGATHDEDNTSASFHSARSQESESQVNSWLGHSDKSEGFMTCNEGSDRSISCWITSDIEALHDGAGLELLSDLDEQSFYTCPRFNDQGLRSALSVPTKTNNLGQFNIPLQVFAASIEKHEEERKSRRRRERIYWLPLKIACGALVISVAIATALLLTIGRRGRPEDLQEQAGPVPTASPRPFSGAPAQTVPDTPISELAFDTSVNNDYSSIDPTPKPTSAPKKPKDNSDRHAAPTVQPTPTPTSYPTLFWFETSNFVLLDQNTVKRNSTEDSGLV